MNRGEIVSMYAGLMQIVIKLKQSYNIIPTDHHLGFQYGGHLESILINISVRVQDGIECPKII